MVEKGALTLLKPIVVLLVAAGVVSGGAYGATQVIPEDSAGSQRSAPSVPRDETTSPNGAVDADSTYDDNGISIELDSYEYDSDSDTDYTDDYGYDDAFDSSPIIEDEGPNIIPIPRSGGTTSCTQLGSFTTCSGPDGTTSCTQLGSFLNCSGPDGTTSCTQLGSFTNCSGPGGQTTSCSELGSFLNCNTSGGYDDGYDPYGYDDDGYDPYGYDDDSYDPYGYDDDSYDPYGY